MDRKKEFKSAVIVTGLILVIILASGCAGAADWRSEPLPGGVIVIRANTKDVSLCMPSDEYLADTIIGTCVTKIDYNDDYIMVQRKEVVSEINSFKDIKKLFKRYYYFVEVKTQKVLGPYSKKEFEEMASELEIDDVSWTRAKSLERQDE